MSQTAEISPLIQTKLHQPRVAADLIDRTRLLAYLNSSRDRPFTLISAPAGYGKTTLVAQWLDQVSYQSAWLSLDENDNDLTIFLSYVVAAIQILFPNGCATTEGLLAAPQMPPQDYLTTTLINEITALPKEFILVLDDYHLIKDPDIHQLTLALVQYGPPPLRLVITTRSNPPFSISRLRATQKITEVRMNDLRFTPEEVRAYLKLSLGAEVSPETVTVLATRTEGWAAGLHLACLALQDQDDEIDFLQTFQGTQRYIVEYLVDEVLYHQPQPIREYLLSTSILDRFCAPLGDAVVKTMRYGNGGAQQESSGQDILAQLEKADLFLVSLDEQGQWYRYHQLFKDLLFHKLAAAISETELANLHLAAGTWLDEHGLIEEAFEHMLAAKHFDGAVQLLEMHRHAMMNQQQWSRLKRWLDRLPQPLIAVHVPLLMTKAWHFGISYRFEEVVPVLEQVKTILEQNIFGFSEAQRLVWEGEVAALWGVTLYWLGQYQAGLEHTSYALEVTPPDHTWVIGISKCYQIVAYQATGRMERAYQEIHRAQAAFSQYNDVFASQIWQSQLIVEILSANLPGAAEASTQSVNLAHPLKLYADSAAGYQTLGYVYYQWNDFDKAEKYFSQVLELRYQTLPGLQVHSSFGLALIYQAQGNHDQAIKLSTEAIELARETGNPAMLIEAYAFASRLDLLGGKTPDTDYWTASLGDSFGVMLLIEIPHITLATILLARGTPEALQQAAELLARLRQFVEENHNTWRLIEVLSLQALLHDAQGERESALNSLARALALAQPGGFIRLFVDLGPPMASLLAELKTKDSNIQAYANQILAAFPDLGLALADLRLRENQIVNPKLEIQNLIEPLTKRELEVLALLAQRLSNKEIAEQLVITPSTVKQHTIHIYQKLAVKGRKQAVSKALSLDILRR